MIGLSIIIPVHNDLSTGYLQKQTKLFREVPNIEVIYVDGGSTDETIDFLNSAGFPPLVLECSNRAQRMNLGIRQSTAQMLLLHHPRSLLGQAGIAYLIEHEDALSWGGFTHKFDQSHTLLKFTSWYSNEVRAKIRSIFYLDHCIFIKRELIEGAEVPAIPIFEDTALSQQLVIKSYPQLLAFPAVTSSIRFKSNGLLFQSLLNQAMKVCWLLGLSPEQMNKFYEKGLELNARS